MMNLRDNKIELSDISILSAHDVDVKLLLDFYKAMYPESAKPHIWKWLNRSSFYDSKLPLVILYNDRIIAHAGMIPFYVFFDKRKYTTSWFIDFAVVSEFQRHGLGTVLVKKWMEFSDLYVTFCNEKSMGIFKKYCWVECFDTYLHRFFLLPFSHPKVIDLIPLFLRKILEITSRPFLSIIYRTYASSIDSVCLEGLNSDSLDKFMSSLKMPDNTVVPIRDIDYISWRLLNVPDRDKYRVFSIRDVDKVSIIIKMCDARPSKYIDLLWVSNPFEYSLIRDMISTLAIWGMNKDYSYIRYYTSSKELSRYLNKSLKSIVNHPPFLFYTKDSALLEKLKHSNWHWELIDSDFERF